MDRTDRLASRLVLCFLAGLSSALPFAAAANTTGSIDRFLIQRNTPPTTPTPVTIYADEFNNGAPPVHLVPEPAGGGVFGNGVPGTYVVQGVFPSGAEVNGRLALDPSAGALVQNAQGTGFFRSGAILATDTDPASPGGLKPIHDFSVRARFDLVTPAANLDAYGIELNDSNPNTPANDFLQFFVQRDGAGNPLIRLLSQRFALNQISVVDSDPFAPPAGAAFVALRLNHSAAAAGDVLAGYLYANAQEIVYDQNGQLTNVSLTNPAADQFVTFLGAPGRIFLDNEGFARAGFLAVALVPEPGAYALMIAGLIALGAVARRRNVRG